MLKLSLRDGVVIGTARISMASAMACDFKQIGVVNKVRAEPYRYRAAVQLHICPAVTRDSVAGGSVCIMSSQQ